MSNSSRCLERKVRELHSPRPSHRRPSSKGVAPQILKHIALIPHQGVKFFREGAERLACAALVGVS